jgi:hypothetical protein
MTKYKKGSLETLEFLRHSFGFQSKIREQISIQEVLDILEHQKKYIEENFN